MRAEKGWRTRYARYGRKHRAEGEFDPYDPNIKGREFDASDIDYEKFREQGDVGHEKRRRPDEALNDEKVLQSGLEIRRGYRQYLDEAARSIAEDQQFDDIGFKRLLRELPEHERAEFIARVDKAREQATKRRRKGTELEDDYLAEDRVYRESVSHISKEINPDPKFPQGKRGQGAGRLYVPQLRDRLERVVDEAYTVRSPAYKGEKRLISDAEKEVLVQAMGQSHEGRTEADRMIGRNKARKMSQQLAQRAQRRHEQNAAEYRARVIDEQLRRAERKRDPLYPEFEAIHRSVPRESGLSPETQADIAHRVGARQESYEDVKSGERRLSKRAIHITHDLANTRAQIINTRKKMEKANFKQHKKLEQRVRRLQKKEAELEGHKRQVVGYRDEDGVLQPGMLQQHRAILKSWETQSKQNRSSLSVEDTPNANRRRTEVQQLRTATETAQEFYQIHGRPMTRREKMLVNRKIKAIKEGNYTIGFSGGEPVNMNKAHYGIRPNKQWHYEIPDKDDSRIIRSRNVEYWDTKTDVGKIKHSGQESKIAKFEHASQVEPGERVIFGEKLKKPDWVEKDIIVPMPGAGHEIRSVNSGTQKVTKFQTRDTNGRWTDAKTPIGPTTQARMMREGIGRRVQYTKQTRIHFVDPSKLQLADNAYDRVNIKLPKTEERAFIDVHGYSKARHLVAPLKARSRRREEDKAIEVYKRVEHLKNLSRNDPAGRFVDYEGHTLDLDDDIARHKQAYQDVAKEHQLDEGRVKELFAIGGAAIAYNSKDRIKKGYLPQAFKRTVTNNRTKHPKLDAVMKKWNIEESVLDVEEAFVQPSVQTAANAKSMIRHPFTSIEGHGVGVGTYGKFRNRKHFIRSKDIDFREMQRAHLNVERMDHTIDFLRENADKRGIKGKFARWRGEVIEKPQSSYTHFDNGADSIAGSTLRKARQNLYHSDPKVAREAANTIQALRPHGADIQSIMKSRSTPIEYHRPKMRVARWAGGEFTHGEKNAAIAAGVLGTAAGAHYLYYRYQNHKKAPQDRESYINYVLPAFVSVPRPRIRPLSIYKVPDNQFTRDFNLYNRKLPTKFGVGIHMENIAISPKGRDYPKNAPLTGRLRLRSPSPGGSRTHALFFDPNIARKRTSPGPDGSRLYIRDKKLPIRVDIGKSEKFNLSRTNPKSMSTEDIDNLVWAFAGSSRESSVRNFYKDNEKVLNRFDSPDVVRRTRSARSKQEQRAMRDAERRHRKAGIRFDGKKDMAGRKTGSDLYLTDMPPHRGPKTTSGVIKKDKRLFTVHNMRFPQLWS